MIFPAQAGQSKVNLCDLSTDSPGTEAVVATTPGQPVLYGIDTGPEESWENKVAFPYLHALAAVPEGGPWDLQWRSTNRQGRSAVTLNTSATRAGFAWYENPIPENELRDGPYRVDNLVFLKHDSDQRFPAAAPAFLTPNFRYPRDDRNPARESEPPARAPGIRPIPLAVVPYWGHGLKQRFSFLLVGTSQNAAVSMAEVSFAFTLRSEPRCSFRLARNGSGAVLQDESGTAQAAIDTAVCRVTLPELRVAGNAATFSANIEFKPPFAGPHGVFLRVLDQLGYRSDWRLLGAWDMR